MTVPRLSEIAPVTGPIDWLAEVQADLNRMNRINPDKREEQLAEQPHGVPAITSPCEGCRHRTRCKSEHMACRSLELCNNTGRLSPYAPRQPSREIWDRMFGDAA